MFGRSLVCCELTRSADVGFGDRLTIGGIVRSKEGVEWSSTEV